MSGIVKDKNNIRIEIKPMPAPRMNYQGRFTARSKKYHAYAKEIQIRVREGGFEPSGSLGIVFYMPIPKSWSKKKKKEKLFTPHRQTPDIDNLIKGVTDPLFYNKGGDQHIWRVYAQKFWGEKGEIVIKNIRGQPVYVA